MLSGFCRRELGVGFHCLMLSLNPRIEVISVEFVNAPSILLWRSLSPCVKCFGGTWLWRHPQISGQVREFAKDCGVELYFAGLLTRFVARSAVCL